MRGGRSTLKQWQKIAEQILRPMKTLLTVSNSLTMNFTITTFYLIT